MIRRIPVRSSAVLSLLATSALVLAAPGAASATPRASAPAAADSTCPFTRTLCLWEGANFTGARFTLQAPTSAGTCVNLAAHGWGNGRAKSARNTTTQAATLGSTVACGGSTFTILPQPYGPYGSINLASNSVYVY
ncbi:peptidase inhibitor family I36 protein [Micromonospora tulbaghiae]|uniref:peptidase inhibitor family I36 protein n=1 Tax=Micromonospora tulbaghiae TaxID=479978 RepID=UPI0033C1B9CD